MLCASIATLAAGCGLFSPTGDQLIALSQLDHSNTDLSLGISIVQPVTSVAVTSGTKTTIQWSDIAKTPGTVVRLQAQREATNAQGAPAPNAFTGPVIHLIGDGTPGSGRDAVADGENDKFSWDLTGVRIGVYQITATIESPDGMTKTVLSNDPDRNTNGVITVTTTLAAATLTFTNPGATDVTATSPTPLNITWTDNGATNSAAQVVLGLDTDTTHRSGNEIILLRDALSTDGNSGSFNFTYVDEDGNAVPAGAYRVFAIVDDNAHEPVTVEATGKLIVVP